MLATFPSSKNFAVFVENKRNELLDSLVTFSFHVGRVSFDDSGTFPINVDCIFTVFMLSAVPNFLRFRYGGLGFGSFAKLRFVFVTFAQASKNVSRGLVTDPFPIRFDRL